MSDFLYQAYTSLFFIVVPYFLINNVVKPYFITPPIFYNRVGKWDNNGSQFRPSHGKMYVRQHSQTSPPQVLLMSKILLSVLLLCTLLSHLAFAQDIPKPPIYIQKIIDQASVIYGVSTSTIEYVLNNESGYKSNAVGDQGCSIGISQLNLCANPEITRVQALDPIWSIDYLSWNIYQHNGDMWTGYRLWKLSTDNSGQSDYTGI